MRTRQKWVGIIVVLVALLFASAGVGQAMGGGHGFGGHGFGGHEFHQGVHHDFHHFRGDRDFRGDRRFGDPRIGIGISPFWWPDCDPYAYPYGCPPAY